MNWRGNPSTGARSTSSDWPRNGSLVHYQNAIFEDSCRLRFGLQITGVEHEVKGAKWLEAKEFQQAGTSSFVAVPEVTLLLHILVNFFVKRVFQREIGCHLSTVGSSCIPTASRHNAMLTGNR